MKRIITLILFLFIATGVFAQTDGITYQAVIIGPEALELPGVDSPDNYLPSTDVAIKFSIIAPGSGVVEFTEIQNTTTDEFGRINLIIGAVEHDDFEKIDWNGDPKSLKVEVDFNNGDGFVDMSVEKLTYVPYVAHRDITATGTLEVDDDTLLNRELTVNGPTTINSTLNIADGNPAEFSGDLNVDGETNLNNTLNVTGKSTANLSGALIVGDPSAGPPDYDLDAPTTLNGSLDVRGRSTFGALEATTLTVEESTTLKGIVKIDTDDQVVIESRVHTDEINYTTTTDQRDQVDGVDPGKRIGNYPLVVRGSTQGIAIEVRDDEGNGRRNGNNFISFWDTTITQPQGQTAVNPSMWGRIEGEVESEFNNNADYEFDKRSLDYDQASAIIDLIFSSNDLIIAIGNVAQANSSSTACAGFGACITTPILSWIIGAGVQLVIAIAQEAAVIFYTVRATNNISDYDDKKLEFVGVTYASGAGDYAEYLIKANRNEELASGDIVGVSGGAVSKNTSNVDKAMVVSSKPIVLGAIPELGTEHNYSKIAFMGQVPVKIFGKVKIGDYIIPSGKNDGLGIAISPSKIKVKDIKNIVGIAWESSNNEYGLNKINVAVGINSNDNNPVVERLENKVLNQEIKIDDLQNQIAEINSMLVKLLKGESLSSEIASDHLEKSKEADNHLEETKGYEIIDSGEHDIVYFKVTDAHIEESIKLAKQQMRDNGTDIENDIFWQKMDNDHYFKKIIVDKFKTKLETGFHFHKSINEKSTKH